MREPEAVAHEIARRCRFGTDRLLVEEWHGLGSGARIDLAAAVAEILTPATTAALPPEWHGDFDRTRAARWIEARDDESPTLLVVDRTSGEPVGR